MKHFQAGDVSTLFRGACRWLAKHETMRGQAKMMEAPGPVAFELTDPRQNIVQVRERQLNPWVTMAEFPWLICGRNDIAWLSRYLPRAVDFSDDGLTWRAGYGKRLRQWYAPGRQHDAADQLQYALDELRPPHTSRRAVISLWDPRTDHKQGWKDNACTNLLIFQIRNGDTLDLTTVMRSNDCLSGDTEVPLLNGETWTLRDLAEKRASEKFWVYSRDANGKIVPGLAHHPRLTTSRKGYLRVVLDSGEEVRCTPDHRFMMRDGKYKPAAQLAPGESLMPLYRGLTPEGYEFVYDGGRAIKTHRMSWNSFGKNTYPGFCIHHADFNKRNNDPPNLQDMTWGVHGALHRAVVAQHNERVWRSPEAAPVRAKILAGLRRGAEKRWADSGEREKQAEVMRRSNAKMWSRDGFREYIRPKQAANGRKAGAGMTAEQRAASGKRLSVAAATENRRKNAAMNRDPEMKLLQARGKVFANFRRIIEAGEPITAETYGRYRSRGSPRPEKAFGSMESALEAFGYNHRVASIEHVDEEMDFYDLTVDEHENFALGAGVFVHNCWWGWSGVNVFNFTSLLQAAAHWRGLKLGSYYHWSDNLHVYERHFTECRAIAAQAPTAVPAPRPSYQRADATQDYGPELRVFEGAAGRLMTAIERGNANWASPDEVPAPEVPWLRDWAYFMTLHAWREEGGVLADKLAAFGGRRKDWRWAAMAWANRHDDVATV